MAFKLDDLTGRVFGSLTVVRRAPNNAYDMVYWWLRCTCGELVTRRANTLRSGRFFTCGKVTCRFWSKVDKNGPLATGMPTNCWVWIGTCNDSGYGMFKHPDANVALRAHVFSWELAYGAKPNGIWVLHRCDNRRCIRPDHLFLGTHQDNMKDMAEKGRAATKEAKVYLASEEKSRMVQLYRQGDLSHQELAIEFGVSRQTVGRVLRRASNKE